MVIRNKTEKDSLKGCLSMDLSMELFVVLTTCGCPVCLPYLSK